MGDIGPKISNQQKKILKISCVMKFPEAKLNSVSSLLERHNNWLEIGKKNVLRTTATLRNRPIVPRMVTFWI